jgi:hypothetical protein
VVPSAGESPVDDAARSSRELTAVLGKILDQLSLSAWMPGFALVAGVAFLSVCRRQESPKGELDILSALEAPTHLSLGAVVALFGAVLIATLLAQAFEFEMIRLLEGYWPDRRIAGALTRWGVNRQSGKLGTLKKRKRKLEKLAFKTACKRMVVGDDDVVQQVKLLWKANRNGVKAPEVARSDEAVYLLKTWREAAAPESLRLLEAVERALIWYPDEHRLLPTRLGNALRSVEDGLKLADGGDLQGFIIRNYKSISPQLLTQLASFRTRLDMYCTLVLVWATLAAIAVPALWPFYSGWRYAMILTMLAFCILAVASYRASIASARGYVSSLRASDEEVAEKRIIKTVGVDQAPT